MSFSIEKSRQARRDRLATLIGVGLGPGDPELVTVKAARLIGEAKVVAYFAKRGRVSHARSIAECYFSKPLRRTAAALSRHDRNSFRRPGLCRRARGLSTRKAPRASAPFSNRASDVTLLCEGDPLLYGSFMHIFTRLDGRFRVEICAGVSGMSGVSRRRDSR